MALTDESNGNGFFMPVAPAYSMGNGNGNNGFGGDWAWIILLLLLGWGNNGFGGGGYGNGMMPFMMGSMTGGYDLYPWLNNSEHISDGFRDAQLHDSVTSVRDGINSLSTQLCNCCGDISTQLCNGFSGVNASVTGAQNALAQQMYTNQIADMERSFNAQTASTQGMNSIQSQLAQCCCDNKSGIESLRYTIATEACADRSAVNDALRDVLAANTASTQRILDQLCQDKIDAKNDTIAQLRSELLYARGQASQDVQTARILAGQVSETDAIYNRLSQCPVGSVPVFGNQPIFTCPTNVGNIGCGCGCNG